MTTGNPWIHPDQLAALTRGFLQRVVTGMREVEQSYRTTLLGVRPGHQAVARTEDESSRGLDRAVATWLGLGTYVPAARDEGPNYGEGLRRQLQSRRHTVQLEPSAPRRKARTEARFPAATRTSASRRPRVQSVQERASCPVGCPVTGHSARAENALRRGTLLRDAAARHTR